MQLWTVINALNMQVAIQHLTLSNNDFIEFRGKRWSGYGSNAISAVQTVLLIPKPHSNQYSQAILLNGSRWIWLVSEQIHILICFGSYT